MDDKWLKFLKRHQGFTFYQTQTMSQCKCNHKPSKRQTRLFQWAIFPSVYAKDLKSDSSVSVQMPDLKKPKLFVTDQEVQQRILQETGKGRVKALFQNDYLGNIHPDFYNAINISKGAGLGTFIIMSVLGSIHGRDEFVKSHQHVKFKTKFRAIRAYQDAILVAGIKTGGLYGLKVLAFTFSFFMSSTCVAAYFNRTSTLDFVVGGSVAGSLTRITLGPKGMFAGGIIGAAIGGSAGLGISALLHASGDTMDIRHNKMIHDQLLHEKEAVFIASGQLTKEDASSLHIVQS